MGLTAYDIVNLPVMGTSAVKTGEDLLGWKQVEWISVIEGPVENFVRKNEFVLSTGIGCEEQPEKLERFVLDVIKSGASMLGIATGRYVFNIPDRILSLAANHQFIILEMPWEVRFGDVLQSVLQEINKQKQRQRHQAEEVRKQLIGSVLLDEGLEAITEIVYQHIQVPVAVLYETGSVRCQCGFAEEEVLFEHAESDQQNRFSTPIGIVDDHPLYHHLEPGVINGRPCYRLAIQNNHKVQGYLLFQPEIGQQLNWFLMNVLEHALTAYALHFAKEDAVEMAEIRLKDNYVLDLAKSDNPVSGPLIAKAGLLGYDLSLPYTCLVGKISYKNQVGFHNDGPKNSSLQSLNFNLQKEIINAGTVLKKRTMATFENGEAIIYLEDDQAFYYKAANQFLDIIERRLFEFLPISGITWGIAKHDQGIFCFRESYQEAKTALEIGQKQHGPGGRTFFEDTRINRLLMRFADDGAIADIVEQIVFPLVEYDKKRKTDLIRTFLAYNQHKGNVSQAARTLNLHRQSLLHRLRNIESLTQLSLVDPDDLFLLELSVRIWMMKK
ncbi:PucR family transcriptional regulator [Virgibacillus senegalensis]|uniref:PucR family transcriptional regulator n=1 Tax=Virgibacillus senegalensis TaxID=1499679 RepID=UPI00069EB22C|nr:PucR family transcriptional regulator [Virgibacillus senegalensis]